MALLRPARSSGSARTLASLAGLSMSLLAANQPCSADVFVWTGEGLEDGTPTSGLTSIFETPNEDGSPYSGPLNASSWNYGLPKLNWRVNGSHPNGMPGANDTIKFGTGYGSGNPALYSNRTVNDVLIDTNSDIVVFSVEDFLGQRTLTIDSGQLTRTATSSRFQYLDMPIILSTPGVWNIAGAGGLVVRRSLQTLGFTKLGPGWLRLTAPQILGPFNITSGTVFASGPYAGTLGGAVNVGATGDYALLVMLDDAAGLIGSNYTVGPRGEVTLVQGGAMNSLAMTGGSVVTNRTLAMRPGASITATPGLDSSTNQLTPARVDIYTDPTPGASPRYLDFLGGVANIVVNSATNGSLTSTDAVELNMPIRANQLNISGTGQVTMFPAGFPGDNEWDNAIGSTNVQSGTLKLFRFAGPNMTLVGTSLTIGQGSGSPALVQSLPPNQIGDGAAVSIRTTGTLELNDAETIGSLAFDGPGRLSLLNAARLNVAQVDVNVTSGTATIDGSAAFERTPGQTLTFNVDNGSAATDLTMSTPIIGASLIKDGAGVMRLTGTAASTHPTTLIRDGALHLGKTVSNAAVGTILDIGQSGAPAGAAVARLVAAEQIADTAAVRLSNSGVLDLNGFTETVNRVDFLSPSTLGSVSTGAGRLNLTTQVSAPLGSAGRLTGNFDLRAGVVQFTTGTSGLAGITVTGTVNNGTIRKNGAGILLLQNVAGDAVLRAELGTTRAAGVTLGGIEGAASIELQTGGLTVDVPAATTRTYTGMMSGTDSLTKSGPGTLVLSGALPNSYLGDTFVNSGVLLLSKTAGTNAIGSAVATITGPGAIEYGANDNQIPDAARIFMTGNARLLTHGRSERLDGIPMDGGVLDTSDDVGGGLPGLLTVTGSFGINNAAQLTARLNMAGTLGVGLSSVAFISGDVGGLFIDGTSSLAMPPGLVQPQLRVNGTCNLGQGTTIGLYIRDKADPPLVHVSNALNVTGTGVTFTIVPLLPLSPGEAVTLIDFSTTASNPTLSQFHLDAYSQLFGSLRINGRRLQFVAPCPADFNGSGAITSQDIFDFLAAYFASSPSADFNRSGAITVQDIFDYLAAHFAGCQ